MKIYRLLPLGILLVPTSLHAQSPYTSSNAYASSNTLPFNNTIEYAQDADGGTGSIYAQSGASISTGGSKASASADLAKAIMTASAEAKAPSAGQRHYATAGANMNDYITFEPTGKDIVIPMKFSLSGLLSAGELSTGGSFVIYNKFGPTFRMDVDLENGFPVSEKTWTVPASATEPFYFTFQIGTRAQSDAPQGDVSVKDLKLQFLWDLPLGVRYTSASGVFAPSRITPVPEPASVAALGVGLVALRRRKLSR